MTAAPGNYVTVNNQLRLPTERAIRGPLTTRTTAPSNSPVFSPHPTAPLCAPPLPRRASPAPWWASPRRFSAVAFRFPLSPRIGLPGERAKGNAAAPKRRGGTPGPGRSGDSGGTVAAPQRSRAHHETGAAQRGGGAAGSGAFPAGADRVVAILDSDARDVGRHGGRDAVDTE